MRASRLRASISAACHASRKPSAYSGAPLIRPNDVQLEDAAWLDALRREAAPVALIDPRADAIAVDASGSIAWVPSSDARALSDDGADETVLLGRRAPESMPPSFLSPRHATAASRVPFLATAGARSRPCRDRPSARLPAR
jgi:hypothetical protein